MSYLTKYEIIDIAREVELYPIKTIDNVSNLLFKCGVNEYDKFLHDAVRLDELDVSKTFLLIHNRTKELLAYMALSADAIKLTKDEKEIHNLSKIPYSSIPALKIGKLAVNKNVSDIGRKKGYGSFLLEAARRFAIQMNESGVACRFLTVDADIEYNKDTTIFYKKNGFVENLSNKSRNPKHTISMRKDILV